MGRQGQQEALTAYDEVPYPGHPFAQTHPDRLATVATLFGLRPAAPDACRLLELGCGDGGNLVPMAYALPGSAFCGVDLSATAVERARELSAALGLTNVDLQVADVTALPELGEFDYVVAHGVYSWIAPPARDALLAACRERLAPGGVAYVSYDVLPGGYMREVTRQMLRWHLRDVHDPAERIAGARSLLEAVSEAGQPQAEWALAQSDASLFHDELAEHHEAVLFTDFVAHAERHGLRFVAEADVFEMQATSLPPGLAEDTISREQYLDFFKGRMFRQTLLCHEEAEPREPVATVVRGMLAASPVQPQGDPGAPGRVEFRGPLGATLTTDHEPTKRALAQLGDGVAGPRADRGSRRRRGGDAAGLRGELRAAARVGAGDRGRALGPPGGERAGAAAGRARHADHQPAARDRRGARRARSPPRSRCSTGRATVPRCCGSWAGRPTSSSAASKGWRGSLCWRTSRDCRGRTGPS